MRVPGALLLLGLAACSEYGFAPEAEPHRGIEVVDGRVVDEWDLGGVGGVDLLFFCDTSDSMTAELETLGDRVAALVERLAEEIPDWHLMAVTGPDGCGVDGWFDPEDADFAERFAEAITTPPGQDEVDEWGLYDSAAAVGRAAPGDCNEGFLRDDAFLHVVIISDEDDNSPGWDSGDPDYWREYVDSVRAAKEFPELVRYSAIAGPVPDGCDGAEPGHGYAEAVEATGGQFLSICGDWPDELEAVARASGEVRTFRLSAEPVESSLEVEVNGLERGDGWRYEAGENAVVFEEDPPGAGDLVHISYWPR